jgi:hypothetical protein
MIGWLPRGNPTSTQLGFHSQLSHNSKHRLPIDGELVGVCSFRAVFQRVLHFLEGELYKAFQHCPVTKSIPKNLSFYFSFVFLRDLHKQKIPRELFDGGDWAIFLHSHVPMERIFDETDQESSKT